MKQLALIFRKSINNIYLTSLEPFATKESNKWRNPILLDNNSLKYTSFDIGFWDIDTETTYRNRINRYQERPLGRVASTKEDDTRYFFEQHQHTSPNICKYARTSRTSPGGNFRGVLSRHA